MKGVQRPLGYTILEVMIVLAVSGLMFLLAAVFINGKQAKTSFQQGVNETASRLQGIIEDVSDGRYSDVPFKCVQHAGGIAFLGGVSTNEQGTNSPCVFMGKMLRFTLPGDPPDTQYEVISLAGARQTPGGGIITNLNDASLTVIESSDTSLTIQQAIPQHLKMGRMTANGSPASGIGFIIDSAANPNDGISYTTGTQTVKMIYGQGADIDAIFATVSYATQADICLTDGTRVAHVTIGGDNSGDNGNQLAVNTKVGGVPCP